MLPKVFVPLREDEAFECLNEVRDSSGTPLWMTFLEGFCQCSIFVDTDSRAIAKSLDSKLKNAVVYERDQDLRTSDVSTNDLIGRFLERYNIQHEVIAQLHINHPFLKEETLLKAWSELKIDSGNDSVLSCNRIQARLWSEDDHGYFPINHNPMALRRTSHLQSFYQENSAFYIISARHFRFHQNRVGLRPIFYEVPIFEAMSVRNRDDWKEWSDMARAVTSLSFEDN